MEKSLVRHSRAIPILGYEGQRKLAEAQVVVAGVGAVGSGVVEMLARQGVGTLVIIDCDPRVEIHNLDRQFLYTEEDVGKPKVRAAEKAVRRINSDVEVVPYFGTFSQALKSSVREIIYDSDVLISAIDNNLGRYTVSRLSFEAGIPHLDGATGGYNCRVYLFPDPREGACYLCTLSRKEYEEISKSFSCTRATEGNRIGSAIVQTGLLAADMLTMEAVKILGGSVPDYNEVRVNLEEWYAYAEAITPRKEHFDGHILGGCCT